MKSIGDFLIEKYGNNPADWNSNECDIRFNLSDIANLIKEYIVSEYSVWYPVDEKLPDLGDIVLVWRGDGYSVCRYDTSRNNWKFQKKNVFINVHSHGFICDDVTHWTYFPKSPKK